MADICDESWPGGLRQGLDIPCRRTVKHTGMHQNIPRDLTWSGKMTQADHETRERLRAAIKAKFLEVFSE